MIFPTIHLNGTPKTRLQEELSDAYSAIETAVRALCHAAPNARDYYVQSNTAYAQARDEHDARVKKLLSVQQDLLQICEHMDE